MRVIRLSDLGLSLRNAGEPNYVLHGEDSDHDGEPDTRLPSERAERKPILQPVFAQPRKLLVGAPA